MSPQDPARLLLPGVRQLVPRKNQNWRALLRDETKNGHEIHAILLSIARGHARTVTLLDGKQAVIVPTPEVQVRAAIHLDEMLHGKAVTQTEQMKAEREAGALAAVQALDDETLAKRAAEALARRSGKPIEDAQLVSQTVQVEAWNVRNASNEELASAENLDVE